MGRQQRAREGDEGRDGAVSAAWLVDASPLDPATFAVTAAGMAAVSLTATYFAARRAASIVRWSRCGLALDIAAVSHDNQMDT